MKKWCLLHSKPRKEEFLYGEITARNIEVFYPTIRAHKVNPRARKVKPYFPGYLFIYVDPEIAAAELRWVSGSLGLVSFGGEVAFVPEPILIAIRKHLDGFNALDHQASERMHKGDLVRIVDGPFAGYEAVFDSRISGNERVRVLLKMVKDRAVAMDLDARYLKHTNRV